MDIILLIVRLFLGLAIAAHGMQKLFGWLGGPGPRGTAGFMESLGFRPGMAFGLSAGLAETVGGLLIAAGFLNPIGAALVIIVMVMATLSVHWDHGFFAQDNGFELPLTYAVFAAFLAFTGPGVHSLDAMWGTSLAALTESDLAPRMLTAVTLACAVILAVCIYLLRPLFGTRTRASAT